MTVIAAVTNGNYTHYLDVTLVSQSVSANTSLVNVTYYINRNVAAGSGAFAGSPGRTFSTSIDGVGASNTLTFDFRTAATIYVVGTYSQTLNHASDGTHTVTGSFSGPATFVSSGFPATSGSGSMVLPTIARASNPTFSANPVDAGTTITITTNRADASFTHEIDYSFGTATGTIATGVGASTTWAIPTSLLNQIPNATAGVGNIHTITYDASSNVIGATDTPITITAPSSAVPTITSVTATEATTTPNVASLVGGFVQGISTLAVAITGGAGVYGSTIVSNKITIGTLQTINASSGTSTPVTETGTVAVTGTVTDSRGRTTSTTHNVTVLAYAKPVVTTATVNRALVGGTLDPNGTYMSINIVAAVQSLVVGTQKDNLTYSVKKQSRGGTTPWASITPDSGPTSAGSTGLSTTFVIGTYSVASSYDVRIEVTDVLGGLTSVQTTLSTGGVLLHFSNTYDAIGVGMYTSKSNASIEALKQIYQNNGNAVIDTSMIATTAAAGITTLATDALAVAGTDAATAVTPHALQAALTAGNGFSSYDRGRKNAIINGRFRTNERGYVSGASFGLGVYCVDRWKASGRVNIVQNPAAGTNTTGWQVQGTGAISRLTGLTIPGQSGVTTAARNTISTAGVGGIYLNGDTATPYAVITPGGTYTESIWVRCSVATTHTLYVEFASAAGGSLGTATGPATAIAANTWTRLSATFTAPGTAFHMSAFTGTSTSLPIGTTYDGTAVLIEAGSVLFPYFDGSFSGASWQGTTNNSPSNNMTNVPTLTFTAAPQGQASNTLSANGLIQQIIERANVVATTWVLSWLGTCTGRVYNRSASSLPAFATSGSTWVLDGSDDVVVEFTTATGVTGTLGNVQFEIGSVASAYEYVPISEELTLCQRYFYKKTSALGTFTNFAPGAINSSTVALYFVQHPVRMRAVPFFVSSAGSTFGGNGYFVTDAAGIDMSRVNLQIGGGTAGQGANLQANNTTAAFIAFDADF